MKQEGQNTPQSYQPMDRHTIKVTLDKDEPAIVMDAIPRDKDGLLSKIQPQEIQPREDGGSSDLILRQIYIDNDFHREKQEFLKEVDKSFPELKDKLQDQAECELICKAFVF